MAVIVITPTFIGEQERPKLLFSHVVLILIDRHHGARVNNKRILWKKLNCFIRSLLSVRKILAQEISSNQLPVAFRRRYAVQILESGFEHTVIFSFGPVNPNQMLQSAFKRRIEFQCLLQIVFRLWEMIVVVINVS